MIVKLNN
jgi:DNA gyrase/topoisomerase IV subunit A